MSDGKKGIAALFLAYFCWGAMPVYWRAIANVPSSEIVANRIIWSMVFTFVLIAAKKEFRDVADFVRSDRNGFISLIFSGFLVAGNWGIYIWAVNHGHVMESSLGYFINPLVSMFLGLLFFHEKLRGLQWCALLLAVFGVGYELVSVGSVPLVSISLALTFGLYGAVKKAVSIRPTLGLFIETAAVTPVALVYVLFLQKTGVSSFPYDTLTNVLLAGAGVATSVPLILFAFSAKRVPLTTVGFVQYVSPTMLFVLGTLVYGEPLRRSRLVTFAFIWAALVLYSADAFFHRNSNAA